MVKDANKPKGRTTAYAFFIQTCREEHKKQYPGKAVDFKEFSQKCAAKWRVSTDIFRKVFFFFQILLFILLSITTYELYLIFV